MTNQRVRQPVYPGSPAVQQPFKPVTVINVNTETRKAIVRDAFGAMMEIRCDIMRAKGNLPATGEQWIIDRQYGDWIFGAILTNTTKGVEIPQENVGGLPEIITAYDERMTGIADDAQLQTSSLEARSIGRVTAKGDLLGGTAADAVDRLPVGVTNQQVLVPDSATTTGLAWKTPLALPQPLTGATTTGRYVGQTGTAAAPTSGSFLAGDWVRDGNGMIWICSVAGSPGTWVSGVNTRITNAEADIVALETRATNQERFGKAAWIDGPAGCAVQINTLLSGWGTTISSTSLVTRSGGSFFLQRAGRWSIRAVQFTDSTVTGNIKFWLTGGGGAMPFDAVDQKYRGAGFPGAGFVHSSVNWIGWVTDAQRATAFQLWMWHNSFDGSNVTQTGYVEFQYLGGA